MCVVWIFAKKIFYEVPLGGQMCPGDEKGIFAGGRPSFWPAIHLADRFPVAIGRGQQAGGCDNKESEDFGDHVSGMTSVAKIARWSLALYHLRKLLMPLRSISISGTRLRLARM